MLGAGHDGLEALDDSQRGNASRPRALQNSARHHQGTTTHTIQLSSIYARAPLRRGPRPDSSPSSALPARPACSSTPSCLSSARPRTWKTSSEHRSSRSYTHRSVPTRHTPQTPFVTPAADGLVTGCSWQILGGPFFTSVPCGRVGIGKDSTFISNEVSDDPAEQWSFESADAVPQ